MCSVIITNATWSQKAITEWCDLNTEHGKISAMFWRQLTKNLNSIFNCANLTLGGTLLCQNEYLNVWIPSVLSNTYVMNFNDWFEDLLTLF